jgi:hypothetical protein
MDAQTTFEGWAIVEIYGHQRYAGYVRTAYYGTACMFNIDVPPLKERERVTRSGCYVETETDSRVWAPPGSTIKQPATIGYSKLYGIGAIFSMTPCDEKAALAAVEEIQPRSLMLVKVPEGAKAIAAAVDRAIDPDDEDERDDGDDDED